ncbi:MAG: alpha-2-macroglobulin family protein [Paracoccaceae bacterium]
MTGHIRGLLALAFGGIALAAALAPAPAAAQDRTYVPDRRIVLTQDLDFPGADLTQIFDTTLDACEQACLADRRCTAFTFNSRSNSCFPKSSVSGQDPYLGAFSGWVRNTATDVTAAAARRAADLSFLSDADFDAALTQARGLANEHITGDGTAEDLLAAAVTARSDGDLLTASRFQGAALNLTDAADQWVEYAQLLLDIPDPSADVRLGYAGRAISATVNAYLRTDAPAIRASALAVMGRALDGSGRGATIIPALRLAQSFQPRDDTAAALDDAIGKYGFRIEDTRAESDSANPRICAVFNQDLVKAGVDYATFLKLPAANLSVEPSDREICVGGLTHGERYTLTFREGLPAASGEQLAKDTPITLYVRDRSPTVSFPGRAYILPRLEGSGIPVVTVNAAHLDLSLYKVSDRNLIRTMQDDNFGRPLDYWAVEELQSNVSEKLWSGTADTGAEVNRDITTRLPLDGVIGALTPGVYALQAAIPGKDPYENPPATQWFVISDLGLTTLTGTDGVHVFARSLASAAAVPGVTVTLVNRANAVIGTATTDDRGYALFDAALTSGIGGSSPALLTAALADDYSFIALTDPEFDLSDRGVAGREAAPPIDLFLSTDRGAYRAGETVNATLLARDPKLDAIEGLPLTVRLMRPDGVEYSRTLASGAGAGGYAVSAPLGGSAPRGTWRIEAFVEDDRLLASQTFLVEDFLPERIDFTLTLPDRALSMADTAEIGIAAKYLFGAPGADLAIEGDYRLSAASGLDTFPGYSFGKYDDPFSHWSDGIADAGVTDADGNATLYVTLPDLGPQANRPVEARFAVRLKEGSGRPVERRIAKTILPAVPVVGIRAASGGDTVAENGAAAFDLIAVGPDGKATDAPVHWVINRLETNYQWYSLYGSWNWEVTTTRQRVAAGDITLAAAGPTRVSAPVKWGNYEIVVETTGDTYAASSREFYAGWYVPVDASETPDTLDLSLDKPAYRPGDTATVRLVPRAAGVALVTVVSNHLIDQRAVPVKEGENLITLPVTDAWGAGAYVTASVIRPLQGEPSRLPARSLGLSYAPVDPGERKLAAAFEGPDQSDPRAPLPVALKVAGVKPGDTAWATIAAVDVGILNLTGFAPPDPEGWYFGQRRLGIGIRDVYGRLIDGRNGAMGTVRSGGDAGAGQRTQAPPPTEELVAYFSGPVQVGADGYARTEFQMPSFNGTVKLMAVVWSKTGVGQAQKDVLVRDPVVVTASVPRFLSPGDSSRLLLEIVHATGPSGRMGLDVTAEGLTLGTGPSGVDLTDLGKATVSIPVTAGQDEGDETIRVALTTPDGKQLVKSLTIPVRSSDPVIARKSRFDLAAGKSFTLDGNVFAGLRAGSASATVAVGPIARFDAPGILATLDRYPYGCTEQLTSKALPLLYFGQVATAMGLEDDNLIGTRVDESIAQILLNQSPNGAFGLWQPDSGDFWLDAFVTDFLSRARATGHTVPDTAFRNALDNLRNQVNYAPDFDAGGGDIAYALMVLAREGAAAIGDLRYYADVKGDAFDTPIAAAQLGAALASYGDQIRADAMFARAATLIATRLTTPEAQILRADYGTNLRDATALLALASEAGSTVAEDGRLGEAVASGLATRSLSTQEATWALLATRALIDRPGAEGFTLNGTAVTGPFVRVLDAATLAAPQMVTNGTNRSQTLTLTTFGVPTEPEPADGNGYTITRHWYTLEGAEVDPASVRQGTRLVAVVDVTPYAGGEARLIIDDPLPAGFEIDNPNLLQAGDIAALDWLTTVEGTRMTEFRQDRFLAAVDWYGSQPFRLAYIVRAISPGVFHLPAATVMDMYRPDYRARTAAGTVTVTE